MNNIGYLFRGYDLIKGNPLSAQDRTFDPGFEGKIFEATYSKERTTDDLRFRIPDHVDIYSKQTCRIDFSSSTIFSEQEYQKDLLEHISVSAKGSYGIYSAAFSANSDYRETSQKLKSNKKAVIETEAICMVYDALLQLNNPPEFTTNFINAVKNLQSGALTYNAFLAEFGTHFITEIEFGSRYTRMQEISKSKIEELGQQSIDANAAASASAASLFTASVAGGTSISNENLQKFERSIERTTVISVGSTPPENGMSANLSVFEILLPSYFRPTLYTKGGGGGGVRGYLDLLLSHQPLGVQTSNVSGIRVLYHNLFIYMIHMTCFTTIGSNLI